MRKSVPKLLTGILSLTLLITPALAASVFPDVDEEAAYAPAVEYLSSIGIMEGDGKGNFNPDATVTRGEMAAIVCRMLYETENLPNEERFSDVPVSHWANGYVSRAVELGIVNGYGDGNFGPGDSVTYEQAVTMIVRALGWEEYSLECGEYPDGYLAVAQEFSLLESLNEGIGDPLNRSSVAILVYNCYQSYV